jgi:hypothetical protein
MHSAGARVLREDDKEMSREAVLLQWERKIEVAERLEDDSTDLSEPIQLHPAPQPHRGRFERRAPDAGEHDGLERRGQSDPRTEAPPRREAPPRMEAAPERRTITITGHPTPARRRRPVMDAQLAQPDRIALWAFLLGLLLVAVAAGTAHG